MTGYTEVVQIWLRPPVISVWSTSHSEYDRAMRRKSPFGQFSSRSRKLHLDIGSRFRRERMPVQLLNAISTISILVIGFMFLAPSPLCGQANSQPSDSDQHVPAPLPKSAVSTVRPTQHGSGMSLLQFLPDGIRIENVPLQSILVVAFGMQDDRISGSPEWAKSERFDIEAKVDDSDVAKLRTLTIEQRHAMLIPLLVDRFDLKFHYEQRDLPIYNLVIAKGGSKLKESKAEFTERHFGPTGRGQLESIGTPLRALIPVLSRQVGRTVFDKTGLTGLYDYTLLWTPEDRFGVFPNESNGDADSASKPDLSTALREQLGLKLEPQKGPVEVVVIDHLNRLPSVN